MVVMKKSRQISNLIGLGNVFVIFRGKKFYLNRLMQIFCLSMLNAGMIPTYYYCFLHREHLYDISSTTYVLLVVSYITLTYIDLLRNKISIFSTMDFLEKIILKCMHLSILLSFILLYKRKLLYIGLIFSGHSDAYSKMKFDKLENRISKFVIVLAYLNYTVVASSFIPFALLPIVYGFSKPEKWQLPLKTLYVNYIIIPLELEIQQKTS